jgi:hypothetical protein
MQKNLYITLQRSATISRCRGHIWHGCTIPFIYKTGFRPEYGKRLQVHDSGDTTTPAAHVANEHVTWVPGSEPCEFYLLPPDGPKSGVHMAWKVSQPAICCPAYAVHASWTENKHDERERHQHLDQAIVPHVTATFLVTASAALKRWNTFCRISITRWTCVHSWRLQSTEESVTQTWPDVERREQLYKWRRFRPRKHKTMEATE